MNMKELFLGGHVLPEDGIAAVGTAMLPVKSKQINVNGFLLVVICLSVVLVGKAIADRLVLEKNSFKIDGTKLRIGAPM